jgi:hypothetical protein
MKLTKSLLMITMLAGVAFAQAPSTPNAVAAQLKKAGTPAKPAAATAKPTMPATKPEHMAPKQTMPMAKPEHVAPKHAMAATKPAHVAPKHATAKPVAKAPEPKKPVTPEKAVEVEKTAAPAGDTTADIAPEIKRGRDPFVSVIMERTGSVACSGAGKKCLIVDQISLKGIVRSQGEAIAVVSSTANKTYFLRENDPVYNGVVVKITPDSIVFRESVTDRLGKTVQREVVKKVNNPAV